MLGCDCRGVGGVNQLNWQISPGAFVRYAFDNVIPEYDTGVAFAELFINPGNTVFIEPATYCNRIIVVVPDAGSRMVYGDAKDRVGIAATPAVKNPIYEDAAAYCVSEIVKLYGGAVSPVSNDVGTL